MIYGVLTPVLRGFDKLCRMTDGNELRIKAERKLACMTKWLRAPLGQLLLAASLGELQAAPSFEVHLQRDKAGWTITWPARMRDADGVEQIPAYELQRSLDLKSWTPVGLPVRDTSGAAEELLSLPLPADGAKSFYRVLARLNLRNRAAKLGQGGAEVFGYGAAFAEELGRIGQITPDQFAARFPTPHDYFESLDWNPTTAAFWDAFNMDPAVYNQGLIPGVDDLRLHDFRLNSEELAMFKKQGFVVSERLGGSSCGEVFGRVWQDDLPVYIAPDPILHAWHRSYDMILAELEETYLFDSVRQMLDGMSSKMAEAAALAGRGPLKDSVLDADYFLAVARSLLAGKPQASVLGQQPRVAATLKAIADLQLKECFDLFGQPRAVDFSQFTVRGHYTDSEQLGRYFRCVMWLGRTDLRVAGGPFQDSPCSEPHNAPPRELGTAIVLHQSLKDSGQFERWRQFERMTQTFVGWTDSMTFGQLGDLLSAAGIHTLADVRDLADLTAVQDNLQTGQLGLQQIRGDWFASPMGSQIKLPRSFTVFGQKFILDSWALSKVVYDDILWEIDGAPAKVSRRVPSALDVAFAVLGNNQIVPELLERIQDRAPRGHDLFRDGLSYQHNLAAVRAIVDRQPAASWNQNLYAQWLATLRELSLPTTGAEYPDAARTRAWAMKDLNTQLASWTQLRHDTVLYTKQSYTGWGSCSYPAGFVDPRPNFWRSFRDMAKSALALIEATEYRGTVRLEFPRSSGEVVEADLQDVKQRHIACFQRFADAANTLLDMSERELRQEPFTPAQSDFLQGMLHGQPVGFGWGGTGWFGYDGWFPKLFYRPLSLETSPDTPKEALAQDQADFQIWHGALRWDALVTDVHTDVPCPDCGDPGSVLHEGVGRTHLLMVAINNGPDRCVYAGPVLSHYEFELIGPPQRLTDPEWKARWSNAGFAELSSIDTGTKRDWSDIPSNPPWTHSFLVPIRR